MRVRDRIEKILKAAGESLNLVGRETRWSLHNLRTGRPNQEAGMSMFTPDFDEKDKSEVTDGGRISQPRELGEF